MSGIWNVDIFLFSFGLKKVPGYFLGAGKGLEAPAGGLQTNEINIYTLHGTLFCHWGTCKQRSRIQTGNLCNIYALRIAEIIWLGEEVVECEIKITNDMCLFFMNVPNWNFKKFKKYIFGYKFLKRWYFLLKVSHVTTFSISAFSSTSTSGAVVPWDVDLYFCS